MEKKRLEHCIDIIVRENLLTAMWSRHLNATWCDKGNQIVINGCPLAWGDYEIIDIEEVPYENDFIDSILVFGDGTTEFRLKNSCEAMNFAEYPMEIIDKIITNFHEKLKQSCK